MTKPPIQNTINYCPCCGTNLRAVNMALSFVQASSKPGQPIGNGNATRAVHDSNGDAWPDKKERDKKILTLRAEGKTLREIGEQLQINLPTVARVIYAKSKQESDSPADESMNSKIRGLRQQGHKRKNICKMLRISYGTYNYWIYKKPKKSLKQSVAKTT